MMTDDELDLLASSYLDGEATPDEVARVEADPELRSRVEELRAVAVSTPAVPPGLAQAQLARAMAVYQPGTSPVGDGRAEGGERGPGAEPVIDLAERHRERAERAGRLRWLTSAAAVLVVGVGTVALINQIGGGEDSEMATADISEETATDAAAEGSELAPAAEAGDAEMADMAQAEMAPAGDGSAGGESETLADSDDGGGDESADAEEALALDEAAEDAADLSAERTLRDLPESGFFPDEPVAEYNRLPTGEEMVGDLELPWRDEGTANCLDDFPSADSPYAGDEVEVIAYLPFEVIDGPDAGVYEALYVIVNEAEEVVVVLQAGSCAPVV